MTINMKKSSPFVNIPTLPTTFSGQWLTFSHMANHYRKLINVKPRVDSNAPRSSFTNIILSKSPSKPFKSGGTTKNVRTHQNTTVVNGRPDSTDNNNRNTAITSSKTKKKWTTRPKMASRMLDYEYHALSKGLMNSPNGSFKGSSSDGYQVVFGPSSIKSSVDAIVSDPEIVRDPEPQLSSISIGEKIRKFLDHIHAQESQHKFSNGQGTRPLSSNSDKERRDPSKSKEQLMENRHNRHSNCFTPFEVPAKSTKKRIVKPSRQRSQRFIDSPILTSMESRRSLSTAPAALRSRERTISDSPKKMMNSSISSSRKTYTLQQNSQSINNHNFEDLISSFSSRNNKKVTKVLKRKTEESPNISSRSGSMGTIHGSDELETEEFLMPSTPTLPRHQSTIQIDSGDLPPSWLKDKVERGVVRINNAYFQLGASSNSSVGIQHNDPENDNKPEKDSSSSHQNHRLHQHSKNNQLYHNHHLNGQATIHHPNKDSSRDSAYGFSSGESMTTRESTPEKKSPHNHHHHHHHHQHHSPVSASVGKSSTKPVIKGPVDVNGKYKSSLSTVASSINQDDSSHNNTGDSSGRSSCSEKSILRPCSTPLSSSSPNKSSNDLLSDEKYINFLTIVTDDIVRRGIYTNKGIKGALKSHLMKRSDLDMDKMLCLLERLRMDMGVPKDDSLNTLEFGYGCVEYSSGPFFYKDKGETLPIDSK